MGELIPSKHWTLGGKPECNKKAIGVKTDITLNIGEIKLIKLISNFTCFDNLPGKVIPYKDPMNYHFSMFDPITRKTIGESSGLICKTKSSDILFTRNSILLERKDGLFESLDYNKYNFLTYTGVYNFFEKTSTGFKCFVVAEAGNFGCTKRTFKINLFMDGPYLNGKKAITLGTYTLLPGEIKLLKSQFPVNFSIPFDGKPYRIVLIADQEEEKNQGYPDSYLNNTILSFIKIE